MSETEERKSWRPSQRTGADAPSVDDWVNGSDEKPADPKTSGQRGSATKEAADSEPELTGLTSRLTLDLPRELHRLIKVSCAQRGTKMQPEIRELLWQKYGNTEKR